MRKPCVFKSDSKGILSHQWKLNIPWTDGCRPTTWIASVDNGTTAGLVQSIHTLSLCIPAELPVNGIASVSLRVGARSSGPVIAMAGSSFLILVVLLVLTFVGTPTMRYFTIGALLIGFFSVTYWGTKATGEWWLKRWESLSNSVKDSAMDEKWDRLFSEIDELPHRMSDMVSWTF